MSSTRVRLDTESQRAVLRGDCYYCWLGQFDKCDSNCNNRRAIPRYGNHDITPSGKLKLRSTVGSESHSEWLINQANKAVMGGGGGGGPSSSSGGGYGVGGHSGRLSRFEILQQERKEWALRHPLFSADPPKLSSLSSNIGGGEDGSGATLSRVAYYGGADRSIVRSKTPPSGKVAGASSSATIESSTRPAHLQIHSCRLPQQPDIPHKHATGSVKVQVTPYSFAEVAQRSALLANEREQMRGRASSRGPSRNASPSASNFHHDYSADGSALRERMTEQQWLQQQFQAHHEQYGHARAESRAVSRGPSAGPSHHLQRARSPSVATAHRGRGRSSSVVQHGKGGVVVATRDGGRNSVIGGPTISVRADGTSSYILSAKVQSVHDMPLPELFQGLDGY